MSSIPLDVLIEAKREVCSLAGRGLMLTPRDAWMSSGQKNDGETLWSISSKIARQYDCSAEDLCAVLERLYPQYNQGTHSHTDWHDIIYKPQSGGTGIW